MVLEFIPGDAHLSCVPPVWSCMAWSSHMLLPPGPVSCHLMPPSVRSWAGQAHVAAGTLMLTSPDSALPGWDEGQGGGSECGTG